MISDTTDNVPANNIVFKGNKENVIYYRCSMVSYTL